MVSTSSSGESRQQQAQREQPGHASASDHHGRTGEGAASALAHVISEGEKHRQQPAEPDEPAGSSHP